MLVDDSELDGLLFRRACAKAGVPVVLDQVFSGHEALELLRRRIGSPDAPDLIIVDLHIPGMLGHQFVAKLKELPGASMVPTVGMSSSTRQTDVQAMYDGGCCSYLVKPTEFEGLVRLAVDLYNYWATNSRQLAMVTR